MKRIDLGQVINTIANVGVIAGIVFLGFELQQNSEMIRGQTRSQLARDVVDLFQMNMNDSQYADVLLRGNNGEELSELEAYQYNRHRSAWLYNWENVVYQHRIGLYDDTEFGLQIAIIRRDIDRYPGLRQHWCDSRDWRSAGLTEAIEGDDLGTYC